MIVVEVVVVQLFHIILVFHVSIDYDSHRLAVALNWSVFVPPETMMTIVVVWVNVDSTSMKM